MRTYEAVPYETHTLVFNVQYGGVVAAFEGTDPSTIELAQRAAGKLGLLRAATKSKHFKRAEKHRQELHAFPGIILEGFEDWTGWKPSALR